MQRVLTFAQAKETVLAIHAEHWKSGRTEGQWRASMRDYVLPRLARKRADATGARPHISPTSWLAAANLLAVTKRTPSSRFDVVSATPSASFGPRALSQRHLDALAT